jgi:hypothetical protein
MLIAIPRSRWTRTFARFSPRQMASTLRSLAAKIDPTRFRKNTRGPKKPPPKRTGGLKEKHVSTAPPTRGMNKMTASKESVLAAYLHRMPRASNNACTLRASTRVPRRSVRRVVVFRSKPSSTPTKPGGAASNPRCRGRRAAKKLTRQQLPHSHYQLLAIRLTHVEASFA